MKKYISYLINIYNSLEEIPIKSKYSIQMGQILLALEQIINEIQQNEDKKE